MGRDICVQDESVHVHTPHALDDWLIELRPHAEALGRLPAWQLLTDRLVAAGNRRLAAYSLGWADGRNRADGTLSAA